MGITQKQLAEELGLSRVWVSRALNNHPGVPLASRQRVQEVAKRFGYDEYSSRDARALSARRHKKTLVNGTIAVLMENDFHGIPLRAAPYFTPLLDGIEEEAARRKLDVLLCSPRGEQVPRLLNEGMVDGVIVVALYESIWRTCRHLQMPLVSLAEPDAAAHCLEQQDEEGAFLLTRHLVELGHRHIALLSLPTSYRAARLRYEGHRRALDEAGLARREMPFVTLPAATPEAGYAALDGLLGAHPDVTAVFCINDWVAQGVLRRARELKLRVPQDLSVAGFNDFPMNYDVPLALTTVGFDRQEMGRRAVQWQQEETENVVAGTDAGALRREGFAPRLLVRESTGRPRD